MRFTIPLAISLSFVACAANAAQRTPIIQTETGNVSGLLQHNAGKSAFAYLGIPYAKPPTGQRRWQPPEPANGWGKTVFKATSFSSPCPQPAGNTFIGKENCLYLNVWKPTQHSNALRPVMVFIPGGGFISGQGGLPTYNGTYLAGKGNVLVVTINYRLGALGFLYDPKHNHIKGNFGILDQQLALKWVHDNIAHFGGDPNKVMLFGESAGAMSVGLHLFSIPSSQPYFRSAIMESNVMGIPYADKKLAQTRANHFISLLCKTAGYPPHQCPRNAAWLRKLPLNTIMNAELKALPPGGMAGLVLKGMTHGALWAPTIGANPIVSAPINGYHNHMKAKPFVIGTNKDESVFFLPGSAKFTTKAYHQILIDDFGKQNTKRILEYVANGQRPYNPTTYHFNKAAGMTAAAQAMTAVMTDYAFASGSMQATQNAWPTMQRANLPTWGYLFTQVSTFNYAGFKRCDPKGRFVCHTTELPYVFHNFVSRVGGKARVVANSQVSDNERALSDKMSSAWIGFTKDPLHWKKGFGYAPLKNPTKGPYVNWHTPISQIDHLGKQINFAFWSGILKKHNR